ncbi:conserved Plasmodium protein, unknown function [Plasmodium sp. gorilla clade G2]|uniref:conserved Plasmodium protein, unknown function n=1 Tax=Plasmodium sp. gorilla clade G2 TaxID=880535 RepID=UPI000D21E031|nr:conserved Plasmodium protein, unknown function [Plasmodium sp. gorilla clade G2]SOV19924.1 conserved Plasmodium protein, unknown function [Plasmodium sp. gorilla clade G2]
MSYKNIKNKHNSQIYNTLNNLLIYENKNEDMDIPISDINSYNSDEENDSIYLKDTKIKNKKDYKNVSDNNDELDNMGITQGVDEKKKKLYDDIKNKDIYNDIKNKDIYNNIKNKDIYNNIKNKDIYNNIKNQDIYNNIKNQDIYNNINNNNKNIHISIYDGQKKRYGEHHKDKVKCREEENILYHKNFEKEKNNDTVEGDECNYKINIGKKDISSNEIMNRSKIFYKECMSDEKNESKNVTIENNTVDEIVENLGDKTCTYEEDDYINKMTMKKKENIEEGIKLLSNLKDDVVIGCMENKVDQNKIKISQSINDKIKVTYNDCKDNGYVKNCDKYKKKYNNKSNNNNKKNYNNVSSFLYHNDADMCADTTFSSLINKDRIYHFDQSDLYFQRNFVESQKKLESKKESITFSFRDNHCDDLKNVDDRCSKFFHNDKDEYTNYMLIKDGNKKNELKEKRDKSSILCNGHVLYGNKSVDRLYNNKCINKKREVKMNDNKIMKLKEKSCDNKIYSIYNRIKKKEENICVTDDMQNKKKIQEKNKIHIKLQNIFDMKTCKKNNDMFTCPMKTEKQIDAYKNYGNRIYRWVVKNNYFNYPTSIKGKDNKVNNNVDDEKKSVQKKIYESKLSDKTKEEMKTESLNHTTSIKNKKGILKKNKSMIYRDNKNMNGFKMRNNLLNILDTSKLYPKCELICRIKKS